MQHFRTQSWKTRRSRSASRQASAATSADTNCTNACAGRCARGCFTLHLSTMPTFLFKYIASSSALTPDGKLPNIIWVDSIVVTTDSLALTNGVKYALYENIANWLTSHHPATSNDLMTHEINPDSESDSLWSGPGTVTTHCRLAHRFYEFIVGT